MGVGGGGGGGCGGGGSGGELYARLALVPLLLNHTLCLFLHFPFTVALTAFQAIKPNCFFVFFFCLLLLLLVQESAAARYHGNWCQGD